MTTNSNLNNNQSNPGIGHSDEFLEIINQAKTFANVSRPILIRGERGTGKELLARYIHNISNRSSNPYVIINCATFQEELFLSEMFGYEKGAFTGATERKIGKLEIADKGTFFLDEVANMPKRIQEKLLRVLEYQTFERIGSTKEIKVDVRIIAATNAPLDEMISKGEFLPDLYDRLCFTDIVVPPLRKRREDIPDLIEHFIKKLHIEIPDLEFKEFTRTAVNEMLKYHWPGNIRELKNMVEKLYIADKDGVINASELPLEITSTDPLEGTFYTKVIAYEKSILLNALKDKLGNQREAAKELGMTYDQFRHYYKKYKLNELLV